MLKVVLDANIICHDYKMTGIAFKFFFEGINLIPAIVCVPEVVLDEVCNKFEEDLTLAIENAQKSCHELGRFVDTSKVLMRTDLQIEQESKIYREYLLKKLKEGGVEILSYPEVPHKTVVMKELSRKKPFKRNGSGYRDFLIWESLKKEYGYGKDKTIFITSNTADFGTSPGLHADFLPEIHSPKNLKILNSLRAFNDEYVMKKLASSNEVKKQLQEQKVGFFDIYAWLKKGALDLIYWDCELESIIFGFPSGVGRAHPTNLESIDAVEIVDVLELESKEKIVKAKIKIFVDFSLSLDWEDYEKSQEVRGFLGGAGEPFSWLSTNQSERIEIGVSLNLDAKSSKLIGTEVSYVEGPSGTIDFNVW